MYHASLNFGSHVCGTKSKPLGNNKNSFPLKPVVSIYTKCITSKRDSIA